MSATISGTPSTAGFFAFTVQAADAGTPPLSAIRALTITIGLPAMPTASVTNVQDTIAPSSQPAFGVTIAQSYPVDLAGSATIVFQPDSGPQSTRDPPGNGRRTAVPGEAARVGKLERR